MTFCLRHTHTGKCHWEKKKNCLLLLFFGVMRCTTSHAKYIVFWFFLLFSLIKHCHCRPLVFVHVVHVTCCPHNLFAPLWVLLVQLFHVFTCLWMCVSESASFKDFVRQLKPFTQKYTRPSCLHSLVSGCPSLLGVTGVRWHHNTMRYNKKVSRWQGFPQAFEINLCSINKWFNEILPRTMNLGRLDNPSAIVQLCFLSNWSHPLCNSWLNLITAVSQYNVSSCWMLVYHRHHFL